MSPSKKQKPILPDTLNDLIAKFSQQDVIAVMEKEYQSAPARLIPITLIDDSEVLSSVKIPRKTVMYFAEGLRSKGFYNPLVVRRKGERFELVLGRKRFFGAKEAGILSLPCAVVDIGDEENLLMLLADARDQRDNNILELALICQRLANDFHYPQRTLAELSHQSRSQITNILRVLKLPASLQEELAKGNLSYGHAKILASLPEEEMVALAKTIVEKGLSVHQAEAYVRSYKGKEESSVNGRIQISGHRISIDFENEDEKAKILEALERVLG